MSKSKIKVLSFGYLPKQYGGKQLSGLATAIFELSDAINRTSDDVEVILSCTDWFKEAGKIKNTELIGWSPKILLKHSLLHPFRCCYYCINSVALAVPYGQSILRNIGYFIFFDYCIEKTEPDVLHLDGVWRALIGNYILKAKKIKKVVKIHGMLGHNSNIPNYKKWRKVEQRIAGMPFQAISFVTAHLLKDWVCKYGKMVAPAVVILNGINFDIFHPVNSADKKVKYEKKLRLLTVGAISESKGQRRVIRAIGKLDDLAGIEYTCIGAGDPVDIRNLTDEAKRNRVDFKYIYYMTQSELVEHISQADYMILPSSTEGFGQVFTESIAVGTPAIIPRHLPIVHEKNIINEDNSIVIEDSSEEAICQGILKALAMTFPTSLVSETVSHLSWDLVASEYCEIFRRLI